MSLKNIDGVEMKGSNQGQNNQRNYSEKDIFNSVRQAIEKYGENVTRRQFNNDDKFPDRKTIKNVTGLTWNEAKEKCNSKVNQKILRFQNINPFTSAEAYVVGVILGDGHVSNNGIQLNVTDKDFAEEFGKELCELLNLTWDGWNSDNTEISTKSRERDNENWSKVWRISKGLSGDTLNYFMRYQNLDGENIIKLEDEFKWYKEDLLRGLWDSEGCISETKLQFSNTNHYILDLYMRLVSDVVGVSYSDGYEHKYYESQYFGEFRLYDKDDNERASTVYIPMKYRDKFFKRVDPTIQRKRERF